MTTPIPFQIVSPLTLNTPFTGRQYWQAQAEVGGIVYTVSRSLDEDEWFIDSEMNARTGVYTARDRTSRIIVEVAEYLDNLTDIHATMTGRDI